MERFSSVTRPTTSTKLRSSTLTTLIAALLLLPVCSAADGDKVTKQPIRPTFTLEELTWERSVKKTHEASLLALPGVHGVGIGLRDDQPVIVVLIDQQAEAPPLPESLNGIRVVTEPAAPARFLSGGGNGCFDFPIGCHDAEVPYPVPMGMGTSSSPTCDSGTLGFKACHPASGTIGYVSANHVAAGAPNASHSHCFNGAPGLFEMHPGNFENPMCPDSNPTFTNFLGVLDGFVPVLASPNVNIADAAFVASSDQLTSRSILDIGFPRSVPGTAALDSCVRKSGRTSGLTPGRIDLVDLSHNVPTNCYPGNLNFEESIRIQPDSSCGKCPDPPCTDFAVGGDSGSALVDAGDYIVGLVFANSGSVNNGFAGLAASIQNVLSELGLTLNLGQCGKLEPPGVVLVASFVPQAGFSRVEYASTSANSPSFDFYFDESAGNYTERPGGSCNTGQNNQTYMFVHVEGLPVTGCTYQGSWDLNPITCSQTIVDLVNAEETFQVNTDDYKINAATCSPYIPLQPQVPTNQPAWFHTTFTFANGATITRRLNFVKVP